MYRHPLFLLFLSVLLMSACSSDKNTVVIKGQFKNLKQGELYAFSYSPEWDSFDTIRIDDGSFSFRKKVSDTTIVILQYPNFMQTLVVAIPGKTITVKGNANNLSRIKVEGSEENEQLSDFYQSIFKKDEQAKIAEAKKFVRSHPQSFASLAVVQDLMLNSQELDLKAIDEMYALMLKATPERVQLRSQYAQLYSLLSVRPGKKLPAFSARTLEGKLINNASFHGKWMLISFWSTWGRDFYVPMSVTKKAVHSVGDKMQSLGICLDLDTVSCAYQIKNDTLGGYQVCDRKGWDSPLVKAFGVRKVPGNILVDRQGYIVARDIPQEDLKASLEKYVR